MGSDLRARASPPWDRKIPRLRPAGFQSAALPSELRPRVLASGISESNRVCPGPKPGGLPSPSFPLVTPRVLNPPPVLRTAGLPRLRFPVHPTPGVVRRLRSCAPAGRLQTGPVGEAGFEPATSRSRSERAAKLRHSPLFRPRRCTGCAAPVFRGTAARPGKRKGTGTAATAPQPADVRAKTGLLLLPRCSWPLSRATGLLTRNWSGELFPPGRLDSRRVAPVTVCEQVDRPCTGCRAMAHHVEVAEIESARQRVRSAPATLAVTPRRAVRGSAPSALRTLPRHCQVEPGGFEPPTFCMPCKRATSCAKAPLLRRRPPLRQAGPGCEPGRGCPERTPTGDCAARWRSPPYDALRCGSFKFR